jgi:hypothetical protein
MRIAARLQWQYGEKNNASIKCSTRPIDLPTSAVTLEMGNGYVDGHARETLELLRTCPALAARLT